MGKHESDRPGQRQRTHRRGAELPVFEEDYFASIGREAALALVSRDVSRLRPLVRKLERQRKRPDSKVPQDVKDRMYGNLLVIRRGVDKITSLENNRTGRFAERREFERREEAVQRERVLFDANTDTILDSGRVPGLRQIAEHAADAVITTNMELLHIADSYFRWLAWNSEQGQTSPKIRQQARGVLDIVIPALATANVRGLAVDIVFDDYRRREEGRRKPS